MRTFFIAALCATLASAAGAQTGTFVGTVSRDSMGTAVGQAEVQLPELKLTYTTNWQGEFQFTKVPVGRHLVTVRAIGFQPFLDTIEVKPGATLDGDIVLTAAPVDLAAQHTIASAVAKRLPPGLQEMEDRRKTHMGGFFVTDSMLRANDERKLTYFMSQVPGIHQVLSQMGGGIFLASALAPEGRVATGTDGTFPPNQCYITIYMNGGKFFVGPATANNPPPDFGSWWARDYSGIEYYPSGATVPAEYNGTGSGCGTLLLWTRR
jgi:hypothetical protein